jgi:hypothetical protein
VSPSFIQDFILPAKDNELNNEDYRRQSHGGNTACQNFVKRNSLLLIIFCILVRAKSD